jgi:membrane protein YdbS with pleckstrin-like domain
MQHLHPLASLLLFFRYLKFLGLPILLMGGVTLLIFFGPDLLGFEIENRGATVAFLAYLIFVLAAGTFVVAWVISRAYRYELGPAGFNKEHGVLFKRYVSIPYDQIQNVDIHRTVIERLMGLSSLQIQTAGSERVAAEGELPGLNFDKARELRDELVRLAESGETAQQPKAPAPAPASEPTDQPDPSPESPPTDEPTPPQG